MAVMALTAIGSVVGGALGGPIGANIGGLLGSMAGNAMFGPSTPDQEGPRMSDLKATNSAYGQQIPIVYGSARIACNIIWATEIIEKKKTQRQSGGGKGGGGRGGNVTTYSYAGRFAAGVCQGPIAGISRVWLNGEVYYDASASSAGQIMGSFEAAKAMRIYLGGEDQEPDPTIQSIEKEANTPAFKGLAYIVFDELPLDKFGNRNPNVEVEVVSLNGSGLPDLNSRILHQGNLDRSPAQPVIDSSPAPGWLFISSSGAGGGFGNHRIGAVLITEITSSYFKIAATDNLKNTFIGTGTEKNSVGWMVNYDGVLIGSGSPNRSESYVAEKVPVFTSSGTEEWYLQYQFSESVGGCDVYYNTTLSRIVGSTLMRNDSRAADYPFLVIASKIKDDLPPQNFNAAFLGAGQAGREIYGFAAASDGSAFFIFTGEPGSGVTDKWVKLIVVSGTPDFVEKGEIAAGINLTGFGGDGGTVGRAISVEEDGKHVWATFVNGGAKYGATCYRIGDDGVMRSLESFTTANTGGPSIRASNGLAVLCDGFSYAMLTRQDQLHSRSIILADIVADLCRRSGLKDEQFDVSELTDVVDGYVVANIMSARSAIEPLRVAYFFDGLESEQILKFPKRGRAPLVSIPEDDLAAHDGQPAELPDQLSRTRMQELELPQTVTVSYFDTKAVYQAGSQYARRLVTGSQNHLRIDLPICMPPDKAAQIAAVNLYNHWQQREMFTWSTTRKYAHLDPSDVVTINKGDISWNIRITKRSEGGNGVINWEGVSEESGIYTQEVKGGTVRGGGGTIEVTGPTDLKVLDLPSVTDAMSDQPSLLVLGSGFDSKWTGASTLQSNDGGNSFNESGVALTKSAEVGSAITILPPVSQFGMWDETSSVQVILPNVDHELTSCTQEAALRGTNMAYIGGEIVSYKKATLTAPGRYTLSGLLRGRFGTEDLVGTHRGGEDFVVLTQSTAQRLVVPSSQIGQSIIFKAPSVNQSSSNAPEIKVAFTGRNMRPLTPIYPFAHKNALNGDWTLRWTRRTRSGGEWRDGVDASLGETAELYDVEIMNIEANFPSFFDASVKRTITALTSPTAEYTVAQQIADWGAPVNRLGFRVYQKNSVVGRSLAIQFATTWSAPVLSGGYLPPFSATFEAAASFIASFGLTPVASGSSWDSLFLFQGASGAVSTTDAGSSPVEMLFAGDAALSNASPKWGTTAARIGTSGYFYSDAASTVFQPGSSAYTLGMEWKLSTYGPGGYVNFGCVLLDTRNSPSDDFGYIIGISTAGQPMIWTRPNGVVHTSELVVPLSRYFYLEMKQEAGVIRFAVDGKWEASGYAKPAGDWSLARGFTLGRAIERASSGLQVQNADLALLRVNRTAAIPPGVTEFMPPTDMLFNFTGADGSTSFTDQSYNGLNATANGAAITTAQSLSPAASSVNFAGGSSRLTIPAHPAFNLGAAPFSVGGWVRPTTIDGNLRAMLLQAQDLGNNSNRSWGVGYSSSGLQFYFTTNGNADNQVGFASVFTLNAWSNWEVCRDAAGVLYGFVNGNLISTAALGSTSFFPSTADMCIGTFGKYAENGYGFLSMIGQQQALYLVKGTCLHTASFTPPAVPIA